MKRRHGLLGAIASGALALLPPRLAAQPVRKVHRVGVLGPDMSDGTGLVWDAFVDELAQRGYVQG